MSLGLPNVDHIFLKVMLLNVITLGQAISVSNNQMIIWTWQTVLLNDFGRLSQVFNTCGMITLTVGTNVIINWVHHSV